MVNPLHWFKPGAPSVETPSGAAAAAPESSAQKALVVPIRSIGPAQVDRVVEHLLALEPHDRYLRFGYSASDEHIRRYVNQLNFDRDELFGIFNRKLELIAMAHLAFSVDPQYNSCAEFGVSVARAARGRGFGGRLFERAVMHARNEGVVMLFIHALTENTAMLKIARNAGAIIERDGSESEAHLRLPPADFDSRVTEMMRQHMAFTDYHLKAQAKQFWTLLSRLQTRREGERAKME